MTRLLFVYGSLQPDQDNAEAKHLASHSQSLGRAYVHGELVDVQGFPGLVPGRTGRIDGLLLLVQDEAIWDRLDAYEGVGEDGWYGRELVVAIDQRGDPRSAWAYTTRQP